MSEQFGSDFITLTDEEGNDFELEHLDTLEHGDETYMAFVPADIGEEDEEVDMVILKLVEEDGEELLATIDDDAELEEIYGLFMKRIQEEEDEPTD